MIELRPTEVPTTRPKILLVGQNVKFSDKFPDYLSHVKGQSFKVAKQTQVTYELSWIIKEATYLDVNLSNEDTGKKLFPDAGDNLYETLIGIKPCNGYIIPYFPAEQPLYRLDYPTMTPLVSDAALKYLGIIRPEDSPVDNPILRLYTLYDLKPIILRLVADDSVDYSKITLEFLINRCKMEKYSPKEGETVKFLEYLDELKW